jgi:hypothetical protein
MKQFLITISTYETAFDDVIFKVSAKGRGEAKDQVEAWINDPETPQLFGGEDWYFGKVDHDETFSGKVDYELH